jgi:uncharacterized membrane protein (DUF2068 family)
MEVGKDSGLRLIIAYKLARGGVALVLGVLLAGLTAAGETAPIQELALYARHHAMSAWSIALANALVSASTPRHLWLVALGLAFDGAFSSVEGWALHRRVWWGPWLVVVATSAFLPFELVAIARHPHAGRVTILFVNLAIVVYLARRVRRAARP